MSTFSDNDVELADHYIFLSNVMSTSQINLSLSVAHELGKNTFLSDNQHRDLTIQLNHLKSGGRNMPRSGIFRDSNIV